MSPLTNEQLDLLERLDWWRSASLHAIVPNALPALIAEVRAARAQLKRHIVADGDMPPVDERVMVCDGTYVDVALWDGEQWDSTNWNGPRPREHVVWWMESPR